MILSRNFQGPGYKNSAGLAFYHRGGRILKFGPIKKRLKKHAKANSKERVSSS
jgi:hypothetical protein